MKKCYVVGAGEMYGDINPCEEDLVVAADGGVAHLLSLGITPDVIVGDFDSLSESVGIDLDIDSTLAVMGADRDGVSYTATKCKIGEKTVEIVKYPVEKDETDAYLAYLIGVSRGYSEFAIYGGVGGREDHTFANLCLLLRIKNEKNNATLYGNGVKFSVLKDEKVKIYGKSGATVSVFAFGTVAEGVYIRGLKYEAHGVDLDPARPLGVSNSFVSSGEGEIEVRHGALLVANYF